MLDGEAEIAAWKARGGVLKTFEWLDDQGRLTARCNAVMLRLTKKLDNGQLAAIRISVEDAERHFTHTGAAK